MSGAVPPTVVTPSAPSKNPFDDPDDDIIVRDSAAQEMQLHSQSASGVDDSPAASPSIRMVGGGGTAGGPGRPARRLRSMTGDGGSSTAGGKGGGCCCGCSRRPCCRRCTDCCFSCTARCTRVLLVGPNLLFLLFGATLVGLGVWMRADRESPFYLEILRSVPASPALTVDQLPVAIIAVGSCVAILSFLGCCGACFESVFFLCLYALFLTLMVAAEIIVGIVIVVMNEQLLLKLSTSMQHQLKYDYNNTKNSTYEFQLSAAWNKMQTEFACCGAAGPEDFYQSAWYNWTRQTDRGQYVPKSCCLNSSQQPDGSSIRAAASSTIDCQQMAFQLEPKDGNPKSPEMLPASRLKTQGCKGSLLNHLKHNLSILVGIGCAVILLQVVDFGFACVLMSWFRKKQSEYLWYEDDDFD